MEEGKLDGRVKLWSPLASQNMSSPAINGRSIGTTGGNRHVGYITDTAEASTAFTFRLKSKRTGPSWRERGHYQKLAGWLVRR